METVTQCNFCWQFLWRMCCVDNCFGGMCVFPIIRLCFLLFILEHWVLHNTQQKMKRGFLIVLKFPKNLNLSSKTICCHIDILNNYWHQFNDWSCISNLIVNFRLLISCPTPIPLTSLSLPCVPPLSLVYSLKVVMSRR